MTKFIIAPDSFKGTLTSRQICEIIKRAILAHLPSAEIISLPAADGGEGFVDSYRSVFGGETVTARVHGPFSEFVNAEYLVLPGGAAVMEMSAAAGLHLAGEPKNPLAASTRGVGEMILHAVHRGIKKIVLGLGGSATTDCGIGMAYALGYRFYDENGSELLPLPSEMIKVRRIAATRKLPDFELFVSCDVDNPLFGENGAAYVFGPQKGIEADMLKFFDSGLKNMAKVIEDFPGVNIGEICGAGAAGGLGGGCVAFAGGVLQSGIETLLDAADFDSLLCGADIVFTGEGRMDGQSIHGKVPIGIAKRAMKKNVPCIALCGSTGDGIEKVYDYGITAVFSSVSGAASFEEIKKTCDKDLYTLADSVMRLITLKIQNCKGN